MIIPTRGIVLKYYPYSDSSIIVKIFTEYFGLQSYLVRSIGSKRAKTKLALFQPLNLLEFLASQKENKSIQHLKEPVVSFHYQSIYSNTQKRSILFFISELLNKTIREETPDKPLFEWLYNTLTWFELTDKKILNFHLVFMVQLSRFLGFYPKPKGEDPNLFFDLQEGDFIPQKPSHPNFLDRKNAVMLKKLIVSTFENSDSINISTSDRRAMIDHLITYYQMHIPEFGEMKSLEILKIIG